SGQSANPNLLYSKLTILLINIEDGEYRASRAMVISKTNSTDLEIFWTLV
ncbi:hypothetical protein SAMN05216414_1192, partial [Nitrosovibrio sp. Nv17]